MAGRGNLEVVVSGDGPVALATLLALARRGWRVGWRVAAEAIAVGGCETRYYALAPDVLAFLGELGVDLAGVGASYRCMRVFEDTAELGFAAEELGWPELGRIVGHRVLCQRLAEVVAGLGIAAKASRGCLPEIGGAGVRLRLDDSTLAARLLVIAEGVASTTREALGYGGRLHDYGQAAVGALLHAEADDGQTAWQRFRDGWPLALLPTGQGLALVYSVPTAHALYLMQLDDEAFAAEIQRQFGDRLGRITDPGPRVQAPLRRFLARRFVLGRSLLVGDAAHAVHPLAGQGLNLGLRDVMALSEALADPGQDPGAPSPLRRYERLRRAEAISAMAFIDLVGYTFSRPPGPLALGRRLSLKAVGRLDGLRARLAGLAAGLPVP